MGGPNDIGLNEIKRVNIRIRNGNEGAQMENFRTSLDCLLDPIRVFEVSGDNLNLILNFLR